MTRRIRELLAIVFAVVLVASLPATAATSTQAPLTFSLELIAEGMDQPVHVVDPGDGSGRLVVVEQPGRLRVIEHGQILPKPLLDISPLVSCCGERGLLSAAFHPDYRANGLVYVDYTDVNGDTVVARYRVSQHDPNRLDDATGETVLTVDQPASNHNGGLIIFGPTDSYLYVGLGDGGGGNSQNGQDLGTLLGKILRIDVDSTEGDRRYAIPPDNPFIDRPEARPEIWIAGVRNPWRFSFDRATGDLWIGDVGSAIFEEVNWLPAASAAGANLGWDAMEGHECRAASDCEGFVAPISGFERSIGCVVTGGYVYRGIEVPNLKGVYVYADYCSGKIWGLTPDTSGGWVAAGPVETGLRISSFGEDAAGEVYVVSLAGSIHRLIAG